MNSLLSGIIIIILDFIVIFTVIMEHWSNCYLFTNSEQLLVQFGSFMLSAIVSFYHQCCLNSVTVVLVLFEAGAMLHQMYHVLSGYCYWVLKEN